MTNKTNNPLQHGNGTGSPHVCSHRFAFMLTNPLRKLFQSPKRIVGEYVREGDTVIDLGCGPGFFSIPLADMVGENGNLIAVDLQPEMLTKTQTVAAKKGVINRMEFVQCSPTKIGLPEGTAADFILAFYMVHETPCPASFLAEAKTCLKPGGKFLIVEPKMHVNAEDFAKMSDTAEKTGFRISARPAHKGGRALLLTH